MRILVRTRISSACGLPASYDFIHVFPIMRVARVLNADWLRARSPRARYPDARGDLLPASVVFTVKRAARMLIVLTIA